MKFLQINVYQFPNGVFLGMRFALYREFKQGEKVISNHDEINSQVDEVRILHNKKEGEVFFRTKIVK